MTRRLFSGSIYSRFILLFIFVLAGMNVNAQLLDTRVSVNLDSSSLDRSLLQLQKLTGFSFAYETSGLQSLAAPAKTFRNEKLSKILNSLLKGTGYRFEEKHNIIIIGPGPANVPPLQRQIKGVIEDKETGERLPGVAVYNADNKNTGTFTDKDGYFSLPAVSDTLKLQLSYMSYKPVEIVLSAADAPVVHIKMDVVQEDLDSVLVVLPSDITSFSPLSNISPPVSYLSFLPRLSGDVDLLSMTKIAPGIQEANNGSGSILVRGGAPDQNLLLIDDAAIYGATHLFGMASSVNALAVKDVDIYKGSFPARFGGRISSVWDIALKSGNPEKIHGSLSLGTFASDFIVEGPVIKDKTTFLVSGRRSYHDYYIRFFTPGLKTFYFQDLNLKLRHRFSDKDEVSLSAYLSKDRFNLNSDTTNSSDNMGYYQSSQSLLLNTENHAVAFKWRHYFDTRLSSDLSFTYSDYRLFAEIKADDNATFLFDNEKVYVTRKIERVSGLSDFTTKFVTKYAPARGHDIEAGFYYTRHSFIPHSFSEATTTSDPQLTPILGAPYNRLIRDVAVNELDFFLEDSYEISSKLKLVGGLHLNKYFSDNASYFSFQPRVRIRYQFAPKWFLDLSYTSMQQSLHKLSLSSSLPVDYWIPSTGLIKPQQSNQFSAGVSGSLFNGLLDLSVESYYKDMKNVVDFLILSVDSGSADLRWDQLITTGKGEAYGIEFSVRKSKGQFKSWLSYALSWSNRTFPDINNGQTFPFKYDRRHSLNLVNVFKLGKHLELSSVFAIQSKARPPVLIIKSSDVSPDAELSKASALAIEQLAYHRLDLGINWLMKYTEGVNAVLNLSVLNVYNRKNAFYYFTNASNQPISTTLMPVAVSLSYTLNF